MHLSASHACHDCLSLRNSPPWRFGSRASLNSLIFFFPFSTDRSHLLVRVLAVRRSDSTSVGSRLDFLAADRHSAGTDKCSATSQSGAQGMAGLVQGSRTARALQRRGSVKGRSNPTTDVWLKAVRIQNANSVHSYGIALFFRELEMPFGNMHQKC